MRELLRSIKLSESEMAYIERLNFELNGLKSLTAQFMSDSPFKADLERFVMVKNEYF